MLNYSFGVRSQRYLQIVDDVLEGVYVKLVGDEARLRISFLPEPDSLPPEEKTDDFLAALEHAKVSDIDYLTQLDALEREGRDDEIELARLEFQLRDRVRTQLGLPPLPLALTSTVQNTPGRWGSILVSNSSLGARKVPATVIRFRR